MEANYLNDRIEIMILYFSDLEKQFKRTAAMLEMFAKAVQVHVGNIEFSGRNQEPPDDGGGPHRVGVDMVAHPEPAAIQGRDQEVAGRWASYEGGQENR